MPLIIPSSPLLSASSLSFQLGDDPPLFKNLSLSLNPGEICFLSGPSGSGKSSLMKCIAGLQRPSAGTVLLDGKAINQVGPDKWRAEVAYVGATPPSFPASHSAEESLLAPSRDIKAQNSGKSPFEGEKAYELASKLGIKPDLWKAPWSTLSTGERKRLVLAARLGSTKTPSVVLLDEPTSSLDPDTVGLTESLLESWVQGNKNLSILWATHDVEQIQRIKHSKHVQM